MRRIGDGDQLLSGILSNCYNEVCSSFKYPLSSELRGGIFFNRGGAILGWCQLVVNYMAERDRQRPGNTAPPQKKNEPENVQRVYLFEGKRVVLPGLLYQLWKREDAAYNATMATAAPVGPDEGKTLGNPNAHTELRRQFAGNRRRQTTIPGRGVIGKKGARRMKAWLLSPEERKETLQHLEVLLYPERNWKTCCSGKRAASLLGEAHPTGHRGSPTNAIPQVFKQIPSETV